VNRVLNETRTTTMLLEGLHDEANAEAWEEFDRRFRPIIVGFAMKLGLREADAADAAQETLARFVSEYRQGRYDRSRGRLRSWLMSLARSRIADLRRRQARRRESRGESAIIDLPNDAAMAQIWEEEQQRSMLRRALDALRETTRTSEKTIQAFELLVVNGLPVDAVAVQLSMSAQDVYLAKSRVAQRLRQILSDLAAAYEEPDA
jgi:RNA polymerase sigma-70 factor (ECF subfamily)